MSLVRFNATQPAISNLFENFFGRDTDEFFNLARTGTGAPAVNVKEDNEAFWVEVAAPGLKKEDFKVTLDNGLLTISTESHGKHEEKNGEGRYTRREFSYRSFSRSFTLPNTVEADRIDARYQDGILHLEIPKKEEAKRKGPRQIAIA
jgi:HSP20 family protein